MKKIIIAMAAIAAFTISSCNNEPIVEQEGITTAFQGEYITAFTESNLTKTALSGNDTDGYNVVWSENDEISVGGYSGNLYGIYEGIGTTSATFIKKGGNTLANGVYDSYYRMYQNSLPERQNYYPGNVIKSSPMHAKVTISNGKPEPAQFHNLCGLLRLKLKETNGANKKISKIIISSDQAMSGKFDITNYAAVMKSEQVDYTTYLDCSNDGNNVQLSTDGVDFHIALPAGTYSGVVINVIDQDGSVCTKKLANGKTLTIERSKITPVSFTVENFIPSKLTAVDLGLPSGTLWANMNVGAISQNKSGDYFAWGETSPKGFYDYNRENYFDKTYTIYSTSGKTVLDSENDVAQVKLGGNWRMPTKEEFVELLNPDYTTITYSYYPITINEERCSNGIKIESKQNGNAIFLKTTDYYNEYGLYCGTSDCLSYWSSTLNESDGQGAYRFTYHHQGGYTDYYRLDAAFRYYGMPVRPVCKNTAN